jgi:hypothetical protein
MQEPRGIRLNNPCLLRRVASVSWQGECAGTDPDFTSFDSLENGIRAGARNFLTHFRRGCGSVRALITLHAPAVENNTSAYVDFVAGCCGVAPDAALPLDDLRTLERFVAAVIAMECAHYPVAPERIRIGCARAIFSSAKGA